MIPGWRCERRREPRKVGRNEAAVGVCTTPGGKALNQAVALARLGAQVSAIGTVGDDGTGRDILSTLTLEGIDTTSIQSRAGVSSAVCVCFVGDDGDNAIVWHVDDDVAVTPRTVRDADAVIRQADAVLITFEMPPASIREPVSTTKDSDTLVIVPPAPPLATSPGDVSLPWHLVDVVVANEAEARTLLNNGPADQELADDKLAEALAGELNVSMVVVTRGKAGCVLHWDGASHRYPAEEVTAVDTTGAGDAFVANLAARLAAGTPVAEAIRWAQSAAAWPVRQRGRNEAMPGAGQLAQHRSG